MSGKCAIGLSAITTSCPPPQTSGRRGLPWRWGRSVRICEHLWVDGRRQESGADSQTLPVRGQPRHLGNVDEHRDTGASHVAVPTAWGTPGTPHLSSSRSEPSADLLGLVMLVQLLDLAVCGDLVPEGSVYRFLAEHRGRVFPDGLFEEWFSGSSRVATVRCCMALDCPDAAEAIGASCGVEFGRKAAATDEGFPQLCGGNRGCVTVGRRSGSPARAVVGLGCCRVSSRRVLDTVRGGCAAVVTQDTVT